MIKQFSKTSLLLIMCALIVMLFTSLSAHPTVQTVSAYPPPATQTPTPTITPTSIITQGPPEWWMWAFHVFLPNVTNDVFICSGSNGTGTCENAAVLGSNTWQISITLHGIIESQRYFYVNAEQWKVVYDNIVSINQRPIKTSNIEPTFYTWMPGDNMDHYINAYKVVTFSYVNKQICFPGLFPCVDAVQIGYNTWQTTEERYRQAALPFSPPMLAFLFGGNAVHTELERSDVGTLVEYNHASPTLYCHLTLDNRNHYATMR